MGREDRDDRENQDDRIQASGTITLIEQQIKDKSRYNLYIDDSFVFSVHEDVVVKHRLRKGTVLNQDDVDRVLADEAAQKAQLQALRWIGSRAYSRNEMTIRLRKKGFDQAAIDKAIGFLLQYNYLNDEQFAGQLAEQRIYGQKKGRMWVKQELIHKGIARDTVDDALGGIDPEREYAAALELAKKKWRLTNGEPAEKQRKTAAFLLRRGFGNALAMRIVRQVAEEAGETDGAAMDDDFYD